MKFYVYELIDPRDQTVFYIGKGSKDRLEHHEREAAKGVYSRKCQRIRDILADGLAVEKRIKLRFHDEKEAYDAERQAIEQVGLENLTNVVPGGGGMAVSTGPSPSSLANRAYLAKWLEAAQHWTGVTIPFVKDGNRLGDEFIQSVRVILSGYETAANAPQ